MTDAQIERLLFHMPTCAERAPTAWGRRFAADMAKRANWRRWRPTRKQIEVMQGMVEDLFSDHDGSELIEG